MSFAAECITHQLRPGQPNRTAPRSPEHLRGHVAGWLAAFSDLQVTIEHMLAEGDLVFTSTVLEGTPLGAWAGVRPTGKHVSISSMVIHRIGDGKICEDWIRAERLGLQELGVAAATADMLAKAAKK